MTQSIDRVDHTIPKEEAVFGFGPEMKPVLEVDPGEVVTFEPTTASPGRSRPRATWSPTSTSRRSTPPQARSPCVGRSPATAS
jgi:acetamidase/formamidase